MWSKVKVCVPVNHVITAINDTSITSLSFCSFLTLIKPKSTKIKETRKHKHLGPEDFHMAENLLSLSHETAPLYHISNNTFLSLFNLLSVLDYV